MAEAVETPRADRPDWARLKRDVCERVDVLAAIDDDLDAPPEVRAKVWNDLVLPNLRLLGEFIENVTIDDDTGDTTDGAGTPGREG